MSPTSDPPAAQRVVLLGASNLTMGMATVLNTARARLTPPLDVLAALGHGRSYGTTSNLLGRGLPGILQCGLWSALASRAPLPTVALVTDIGNDILYGSEVEKISAWVAECLDRLTQQGARVVLTRLPLGSMARLSPRRFRFFRMLMFPSSRLTWNDVQERAHALDARVVELAERFQTRLVPQQGDWYGLDPIHFRRSLRKGVWGEILGFWAENPGSDAVLPPALVDHVPRLAPETRTIFGIEQRRAQPCARLTDGSTVSVY